MKTRNERRIRGTGAAVLTAVGALLYPFAPQDASAQGVVVDQGEFSVSVDGRQIGTEEFVVRRAGLGSGDKVFANGVVALEIGGAEQELRLIMRAAPGTGKTEQYEVEVRGTGAAQVRVSLTPQRRYVATIRSEDGAEDREFQARPTTRVLERDVAHHYYFLRNLRPDDEAHILEPRSRAQATATSGPHESTEIELSGTVVPARRVTFTLGDGEERTVWFDRQGRVLRVEVPARRYVAQRTDLVG
ncbi:MAG: hypothetical protein AAF389_09735 [Gemmatimonadota bacterium]